jgi:ADP-ribose pyrophosphatase YjhB (NUDIX family)
MTLPQNTIIASGPVIIENNKVLLNREIKSDGNASPYLMFPGGTVDDFSIPLENTAAREAKEELGIDIEIVHPLRTLIVQRQDKEGIAILVHYLAKKIGDITPGQETVEWGWYDIDDLPKNCAQNVFEIIKDLKK